jgi:hypothetical protein
MANETSEETPSAQALLARQHLFPNPDEIPFMDEIARQARADADRLYAVPEARYEDPSLIFHPRP